MRILFMSPEGDGFGVAYHLAQEGNEILFWTAKEHKLTGSGFPEIKHVDNWMRVAKECDFAIVDMVKMGRAGTMLRGAGIPTIGSHEWADKVELDRALGQSIMEKTGATIPDYKEFTTIKEGIAFLKEADKPYVFKPEGNKNNSWTFVPKDESNEATISFMEGLPSSTAHILQEKVNDEVVEISTEGWFNGRVFLRPFNHTIERKRLMVGDRGPQTGCMGNVVWTAYQDKLIETILLPLEKELEKVGYIGPIDVNCLVGKEKAYFLEFTARFGYDAIQTLLAMTNEKTKFLFGVASRSLDEHKFENGYAIGVRLAVSPYPARLDKVEEVMGMRVIENPNWEFWPSDIYTEDDKWLLSGPVVGVQTALNETIDGARELVYKAIDDLVISKDVMWREDIAKCDQEKIDKLKGWGWL